MVRATVKRALGEILRRWEPLKQIYGCVPSAQRDFNFAYFHVKQTQRPHGPVGYEKLYENMSFCDYEEKETLPKLRCGLRQASRIISFLLWA